MMTQVDDRAVRRSCLPDGSENPSAGCIRKRFAASLPRLTACEWIAEALPARMLAVKYTGSFADPRATLSPMT